MNPSRPLIGLLVFAAWVAIEIAAFGQVAAWTGGGVAFFLLVMKSVLGALFVKRAVSRKILDVLRRGGGAIVLEGREATDVWLKGLGGFLLVMPGFVSGLAGLALLTPPIRAAIVRRSGGKATGPREIDLDVDDWRETKNAAQDRLPGSSGADKR